MSAGTFKAAMIQLRSGLAPAANIDAAARLIGEATSAGADYVQTPEMTNLLAAKREEMVERAEGRMTVPQIFIGGRAIGGSDELHALERAGKLDALLAEEGQSA